MAKKSKKNGEHVIAANRKSRHDYQLLEHFEAGVVLEGWEVKSLREGRAQLRDSYIIIKGDEAFLIGAHISVLNTTAAHTKALPTRTRKLLLHRRELNKLNAAINQKGLTAVPLDFHWCRRRVKLQLALARGKKLHDKRETLKQRAQQRDTDRDQRDR